MIIEYHRPKSLDEALQLLRRETPKTVPLGGGTVLSRSRAPLGVVDLQALGLDQLVREGQYLKVGAASTLQALYEADDLPEGLRLAIHQERSVNLRRMATVAGALVTADGRSPFATALLALDARLSIMPGEEEQSLGGWLPLRGTQPVGYLITEVQLPLNVDLAFECVARTPLDRPIVMLAMAKWPSGRMRVAAGGFGPAPLLVMDGPEPGGIVEAVRGAFEQSGDAWASAEYRLEAAVALAQRISAPAPAV